MSCESYRARLEQLDLKATEDVLIARLDEKILELWKGETRTATWQVSSGARPRSCVENSLGTPDGLHELAARIGDGAPPGMIFKGRVPTGECWHERPDAGPHQRSFVTTRILRLRGLEAGRNAGPGCDSFNRYIYIHGTNHPERFPENVSHGCLLMRDPDLIDLFDRIPEGTHVWLGP